MSRHSNWPSTKTDPDGVDASVDWEGSAVPCDNMITGRCIATLTNDSSLNATLHVDVSNDVPPDYSRRTQFVPTNWVSTDSVTINAGNGVYDTGTFALTANFVRVRLDNSSGSGTLDVKLMLKGND